MSINLAKYVVPSTVIYYDSVIERKVGFAYGLSTNVETGVADLVKFPAGKYETEYEPFFEISYKDPKKSGDIFLNNYPYNKAFTEKKDIYYISFNENQKDLYYYEYDNGVSGWTTDKNNALAFFTEAAAAAKKQKETNVISVEYLTIKDLVTNGLVFPCSSFVADEVKDYKDLNGFDKPLYTIDDNIKYYDSKVENKIAYTYGLSIINNIGYLVKLANGRFNDSQDVLSTKYTSFFNFVKPDMTSCTVFENYYPEEKSYTTTAPIYFIKNVQVENLYWDVEEEAWTSILDNRTNFFTAAAAEVAKGNLANAVVASKDYKIKYLVANNAIEFPCLSFKAKNLADYK